MTTYNFVTIDDPLARDNLPEWPTLGTAATGVNTNGEIVGYYYFADGQNELHAFSYDAGTFATFGDALGPDVYATGINDLGQIVGLYRANSHSHGFIYNNGVFTELNFPFPLSFGSVETYASGINNRGEAVGSTTIGNNVIHGFLYDGANYSFIDYPGALGTNAFGINDTDQIVGCYTDANGHTHGFLYSSGTFITLDDPLAATSGPVGTVANGINNAGQIVGYYADGNGISHGFLYSAGTFVTIDDPLAADSLSGTGTVVSGINDLGELIGYYHDTSGVSHGFITSATEGVFYDNFNRADGLPLNGWSDPAYSSYRIESDVLVVADGATQGIISRPVNLAGPVSFSADITWANGAGGELRYDTAIMFGMADDFDAKLNFQSGYGIYVAPDSFSIMGLQLILLHRTFTSA